VTRVISPIERIKKLIGIESEPVLYEIDAGAIRLFAQSILDNDPLFFDEEYAQKTAHHGVIAPPTFYGGATSIRNTTLNDENLRQGIDELVSSGWIGVNGGDDFELLIPIKPGDTLTCRSKIVDVTEKQGRSGNLIFVTNEKTFTNQDGKVALIRRTTGIYRKDEEEPAR